MAQLPAENTHCVVITPDSISGDVVEFGLPLPAGKYQQNHLALADEQGNPVKAQYEPMSFWPDKSLRWCKVILQTQPATDAIKLFPTKRVVNEVAQRTPFITQTSSELRIRSKDFNYRLSTSELATFAVYRSDGQQLCQAQAIELELPGGTKLRAQINETSYQSDYALTEPLCCAVRVAGAFLAADESAPLNFTLQLKFHYASNRIDGSLQLHNPQAAQHIDGTWDLGDANSMQFKGLSLIWASDGFSQLSCADEQNPQQQYSAQQDLRVYQESSGGEAWNSPVHVNAEQQVPMQLPGFQLTSDQHISTGKRIQPLVQATFNQAPKITVHAGIDEFWQQFPSAIAISNSALELALFPSEFPDLYELQAGEKKTQRWSMCLSPDSDQQQRQTIKLPTVALDSAWVCACHAMPWLTEQAKSQPLQAVIEQGLFGPHSLLEKRELADQYGWRNFGELYADHEAQGYEGDTLFVSHYNNQYDPVLGLLNQAIVLQSNELRQQADELARHVLDIDIYHTELDKDEYNHGLFWHTDHYQQAKTCTHRTYSKLHRNDVYADHVGGGGPGGQHCYTTGLTIHYFTTGCEDAKQAVLKLGDWISNVYEGQGTLIELLLAWKNRYRADLKNLLSGQYPLDRGTGNYIIALLDCYSLTEQQAYLSRVANIIRNTVHPNDEIAARNFDDVEETWFYTVFFQAVARFLWLKTEQQAFDQDFLYARDALLHYADWMVSHEDLSLVHPERLEFPTLTWTAQDLRKVDLLYLASFFAGETQPQYVAKAEHWYQQICAGLEQDDTRTHTRVLAILMQNNGVREWVQQAPQVAFPPRGEHGQPPANNRIRQVVTVSKQVFKALTRFSPQRELDQINRRFPQLAQRWRR
ncbi:hypothetical protein IC617_13945 [Neiella sp. HB171785]|uniref:PcRGLX/YetA-like N-terminal RIFT barrel domain-containing protein n=1 Tax=Neiella litorisoli TaxID=2771431 RepID=A0A8J6R3M8_9GAMM|nr:hypothetical protein [Neiella litorisoli]MBD1390535.1 hypothetical protein [Neiella litorisoli]